MADLKIGYARVSSAAQDVAQRDALTDLGVDPRRIYVDHGPPAPSAPGPGCERRWPPAAPATLSS
jgi:hypothetical protein